MDLCPSLPYQLKSKNSCKEFLILKVTDSFLEKIEDIVKNGLQEELSLSLNEKGAPSGIFNAGPEQFQFSHSKASVGQGSLECLKQSADDDTLSRILTLPVSLPCGTNLPPL